MKYILIALTIVVLLVVLLGCGTTEIKVEKIENNYLVGYKQNVAGKIVSTFDDLNVKPTKEFKYLIKDATVNLVTLNDSLYSLLSQSPNILYIEEDRPIYIAGAELHSIREISTLAQTLPPGIDRIDADLNPIANINGVDERVDVDICILDTGIDPHPDLNVYKRKAFVNEDPNIDLHGHGTHVSGTAAAIDNSEGVVGVAPGARLWAGKVLTGSGSGSWSSVAAGMDWASENSNEVDVVSMSLGGTGYSTTLRLAAQNLANKGVWVVVAAGNSSADIYGADGTAYNGDDFSPASIEEVSTISAMADTDGKPGGLGPNTPRGTRDDSFVKAFSNHSSFVVATNPVNSPGRGIDLAMPGDYVLSTYKGGALATMSGTSMACPHAAGLAGLIIAEFGKPNNAQELWLLRQFAINNGFGQIKWRDDDYISDRDIYYEPLGNALTSGNGTFRPVIEVYSPINKFYYMDRDTVLFHASANDHEDGNIDSKLRWDSNISGFLNWGSQFELVAGSNNLPNGKHTIQVSVVDNDSNTSIVFINIEVTEDNIVVPPIWDIIPFQEIKELDTLKYMTRATHPYGFWMEVRCINLGLSQRYTPQIDTAGERRGYFVGEFPLLSDTDYVYTRYFVASVNINGQILEDTIEMKIQVLPGCCKGVRGDINWDGKDNNVADMTYLIDYLFRGGKEPKCLDEADLVVDGKINVLDLTYIINDIYRAGPPPPLCEETFNIVEILNKDINIDFNNDGKVDSKDLDLYIESLNMPEIKKEI